ncbi:histone-fold-containing protein [Dipodascopsis tothii]|uniref:histone-fold-containing protein n=1 Tax=Dipodascopsis tothii TaxID=44089 RepID=UPI0034CF330A
MQNNQVQYDSVLESGGHYGAASAVVASGNAPAPTFVGGAFTNVAQGLAGHYRSIMMSYWQETINSIERDEHEFKIHQLPLARIKKVMKADEDVKMISAEAPILFAKGCDIFITELTMRAWIHAEENKRRTLQRSDIASALQKSDMFDFLIDIVPREEATGSGVANGAAKRRASSAAAPPAAYAAPLGSARAPAAAVRPDHQVRPDALAAAHTMQDDLPDDSDEFEPVVDGVDELNHYHVGASDDVDDAGDAFVQYHMPASGADVMGAGPADENQLDSVYGTY